MQKLTPIILLLFLSTNIKATPYRDSSNFQGNYIEIGAGLGSGSLRDMGTSPLFYTGLLPSVSLDYHKYFGKNILQFNVISYNGIYLHFAENQTYSSSATQVNAELIWYRQLGFLGNTAIQHQYGISIDNYTGIRTNQSFGNAGFSFENISSIHAKYGISRMLTLKAKDKKFLWLIKYHRKKKQYIANFNVGLPIYSLFYRQGYTNPGNSTLDYVDPFEGYETTGKFLSGMNTQLAINRILDNGNMYGFSYNWSFLTTGKNDVNQLNISHHAILFHLVFKFN
ncbi:MAG: hypothetical protein PF448_12300 [Bacteroidales bacterium]|jgi:hypothetical protein|nr:hypothetical protein [Bacteroidales bacterium]